MQDRIIRNIILVVSYITALVLAIMYIEPIFHGMKRLFDAFDAFFVGMVIAFILNKPCMFIEGLLSKGLLNVRNKNLRRVLSIIILYVISLALFGVALGYLIPNLISSISDLISNIDTYSKNMQELADNVTHFLGFRKGVDMSDMFIWTAEFANKLAENISEQLSYIINLTSEGMAIIGRIFFSVVFSVYFLSGKERLLHLGRRVFNHYLPEKIFKKLDGIYRIIADVFGNYLIGQIIEASILGVLCFLGMMVFRFDYPLLISVLIGITSLVPMVGPYIGVLIAFRILVMINPAKALLFIVFIIVLQQIEGYFIYPRVVGKGIGLHGIWVILSVMVGASLGGVTGIIIGVPIMAIIYKLISRDINRKDRQVDKI